LATRAASGIPDFDVLMERVAERAPARRLVTIEEVGAACVFLASQYAGAMTGDTIYIDGAYHILGRESYPQMNAASAEPLVGVINVGSSSLNSASTRASGGF
jgi:enoyl-[acyl-carrier-protein] reductase (NADH)